MKIMLIRHGQTQWNVLQKYQGQTDIPLNNTGREQAAQLAVFLKQESIEAIYCSDLCRAMETAKIISSFHTIEPVSDPRWREFNFGRWEGLTYREIDQAFPEEARNWFEDTRHFKVPGGESFGQMAARVEEAFQEIERKHRGTVVVVTHGGVIRVIRCIFDPNGDLWRNIIETGSVTCLNIENGQVKFS